MRSKRRASPSLRIICVDVGWPAGAVRRGRVAPPSSPTGAAVPGRAVRVLRTPTEPRARYAPTQERVARSLTQAARLNRCAVQADAASGWWVVLAVVVAS